MDWKKDLEYEDLVRLADEYSFYVMEFPEYHDVDYNNYPVSIHEFYENEFQDIINGEKDDSGN